MRREPGCFLERTRKVEPAEPGFASQLFDCEALAQAFLDPIPHEPPCCVRQASPWSNDQSGRRRPQHVDEKRIGEEIDVERALLARITKLGEELRHCRSDERIDEAEAKVEPGEGRRRFV